MAVVISLFLATMCVIKRVSRCVPLFLPFVRPQSLTTASAPFSDKRRNGSRGSMPSGAEGASSKGVASVVAHPFEEEAEPFIEIRVPFPFSYFTRSQVVGSLGCALIASCFLVSFYSVAPPLSRGLASQQLHPRSLSSLDLILLLVVFTDLRVARVLLSLSTATRSVGE